MTSTPPAESRVSPPATEAGERAKTVAQAIAILVMGLIVGTILHKGYVDISRLAELHPGDDFWPSLGRYFFKNLAGGKA